MTEQNIHIDNIDGIEYLKTIPDNSINLVLTDPPYITSSETGMGNLHKQIKENKANGNISIVTEIYSVPSCSVVTPV